MEQSHSKPSGVPLAFIGGAMCLLLIAILFGCVGAVQYVVPGLFKDQLSFEKVRPLHVSSAVFWIILSAAGALMTYLQQFTGKLLYSKLLLRIQALLFFTPIAFILVSYMLGIFGGREYWEFPPVFSIPLAIGWILFLINFFRSVRFRKPVPVYVWMWVTGICFFMFTYLESNLWLIPYFRNDIVNDMLIQWKSYGSMVGAWNMMIYGSSLFLLDKISGDHHYSRSPIAFALYFLGLFNLMFNWGHHIYTLPAFSWIKNISYLVSMTELVLIGRIFFKWRSTLDAQKKYSHIASYRFIMAADLWILLSLLLAVAMSVPAVNLYTHGTHITVAHTMGATIGINSFLLLAIAVDIIGERFTLNVKKIRLLRTGLTAANISLLIFWVSLIAAGVWKARWQMNANRAPFAEMMQQLRPFFLVFLIAGICLAVAITVILLPLLKRLVQGYISAK
jgi:nitric oxide reductase subunit B